METLIQGDAGEFVRDSRKALRLSNRQFSEIVGASLGQVKAWQFNLDASRRRDVPRCVIVCLMLLLAAEGVVPAIRLDAFLTS